MKIFKFLLRGDVCIIVEETKEKAIAMFNKSTLNSDGAFIEEIEKPCIVYSEILPF
jgi:hypothetical protein